MEWGGRALTRSGSAILALGGLVLGPTQTAPPPAGLALDRWVTESITIWAPLEG